MKVGVIGPQHPDDFADNINDSLTAMGIDNVRLGPLRPRPKNASLATLFYVASKSLQLDTKVQERLVRRALAEECTIVVSVDGSTLPSVVHALRTNGIPVALWFPDPVSNLGREQMLLAPYTCLFFKEPRIVDRLRRNLSLPAYYLPEACNPRWHTSSQPQGIDPVVAVAGSMYPSRLVLLERLVAADIPLALYGGGFPRWIAEHPMTRRHTGRYIVRREKADIFRRSAAVLNSLQLGEIDGVNCRLFEATASGAVVLAEWRPTVRDLFATDELLLWSSLDELVDQARRAVSAAGALADVGDRAAARAESEHTYALRLRVILEMLA